MTLSTIYRIDADERIAASGDDRDRFGCQNGAPALPHGICPWCGSRPRAEMETA